LSAKLVVAYAFDILPPQTKEFLDALGTEIAFCRPDPRSATVSRAAFDSAKHEIEAAARWGEGPARSRRDADRRCHSFLGGKEKRGGSRFLASHAPRRREDGDAFQRFARYCRFKNFP